MATERFSIGPFKFTFRNGRVWWRYSVKHFGVRIHASGATSISTAGGLRAFFDSQTGAYGAQGLNTFVRYHMGELPGAIHWGEHYTRCRATVATRP